MQILRHLEKNQIFFTRHGWLDLALVRSCHHQSSKLERKQGELVVEGNKNLLTLLGISNDSQPNKFVYRGKIEVIKTANSVSLLRLNGIYFVQNQFP